MPDENDDDALLLAGAFLLVLMIAALLAMHADAQTWDAGHPLSTTAFSATRESTGGLSLEVDGTCVAPIAELTFGNTSADVPASSSYLNPRVSRIDPIVAIELRPGRTWLCVEGSAEDTSADGGHH